MQKEAPRPSEVRSVPIHRTNPAALAPVFANDFAVMHTATEFYLTFSLIDPPVILSPDDMQRAQAVEAPAEILDPGLQAGDPLTDLNDLLPDLRL